MSEPETGLCDRCMHQRLIRNTRGSTFSMCQLSRIDPRYPRYPRLPVRSCGGFRLREDTDQRAEEDS